MAESDADWHDEKNNTLYKYPGKAKSKVWLYFGFMLVKPGPANKDNLDLTRAVCRLCKKTYAAYKIQNSTFAFKMFALVSDFCY